MKAKRKPIDFLADHFNSQEAPKREPIDFLAEEPEESIGTAAMYAIPRIATDLAKSGYNFATQTLPDAYQAAKTEVPGFLNPMEVYRHPLHRAGQVLAGALEQGQNINRWPRNAVDYAASRLHLLPKEWEGKFPVGKDISGAIHNDLGEPQYPGEGLARVVGRNFLNLANLTSALNRMPHLTKKGGASKLEINKQRMANQEPLNVNPNKIEDMRKYLPDDEEYRDLVDAAHSGDYNKLFNLQSDVGKISRKRTWDFMSAQREKGQAGLKAVNSLLSDMHKDMQIRGLRKESELLSQGRRDFARYHKFKPTRNALLLLGAYSLLPKNKIVDTAKNMALRKLE